MSPEAKAAGKRETATAKGRPVTESPMSQSPEDSISVIKPDSIKCKPTGKSQPGTKKETIVKLIGKKALAQCNLRSQIDRIWKDKYLPTVEVRPLVELMGMTEKLEVYAINGDLIPFDGWAVITVNLQGNDNPDLSINVPFLVSHIPIEKPLLGFNVVEELIQGQPERLVPTLVSLPSSAIAVSSEEAPFGNHSTCNIAASQNTILGYIHPVETVLETDRFKETKASWKVHGASVAVVNESSTLWHPPVDLSHLSGDQQAVVKQMLHEESASFAQDGDDVGCIPSLQMSINLKDDIPVQHAYSSIPKPLFKEVKEYIQDLLAKGWIVKSKSPYSAPVVCVRKKDGSLRLCLMIIAS